MNTFLGVGFGWAFMGVVRLVLVVITFDVVIIGGLIAEAWGWLVVGWLHFGSVE